VLRGRERTRASERPQEALFGPAIENAQFEQASFFLVGHAWNGDSNARDLLELIFPQRKANALDVARHPSEDND
jgi:hypothetical protein